MPDVRHLRPSISVVLPFRDAGATIDVALSGLLAEDDPAREVLAVDDGSTDSGTSVVQAWAERDPRVRLLEGGGRGLVAALNLGLTQARGTLVARMDADDIAHPQRLSRQRDYLCAQPEVAILGCRVDAVGGGEGLQRYVAWQNELLTPEQHMHARFIESPLCHPSIMGRREVFAEGYRDFDGPEDYDLLLRSLAAGHALAKLPDVLLAWHHREGRATFADGRYARARFRATKAPYLARMVVAGRKLALWGAGQSGRRLARELAAHGVDVALFIDPWKSGTLHGAPIAMPAALDPDEHLVIVAVGARGARELIRPQLEARGFREGVDLWFAS